LVNCIIVWFCIYHVMLLQEVIPADAVLSVYMFICSCVLSPF